MKRLYVGPSAVGSVMNGGNSRRGLSSPTTSSVGGVTNSTASSPLFFSSSSRWLGGRISMKQSHRAGVSIAGAQQRRPRIERVAVAGMLLIAWAWIMVFLGMIFYHGYQYRTVTGGRGAGDRRVGVTNVVEPAGVHQAAAAAAAARIKDDTAATTTVAKNGAPEPFQLEPQGSPLIVFTCNREEYLRETLLDILKFIPSDCKMGCPVIVSQDGNNPAVKQVIAEYQSKFLERKGISLIHLEHKSALRRGSKSSSSYQALAVHYGWALRQVFDGHAAASKTARPPQRVLILEEDLHIAPDFFDYFGAMAPILEKDKSLLAVSAFNDNGFQEVVKDSTRVLRSDFFPGLGWMMTRKLWTNELQLKWPGGYWDDWLRDPAQRQGRHTLRPEVSRTFHFGTQGGASGNQFGSKLGKVFLNNRQVDWTATPETPSTDRQHWSYYLQDEDTFDLYYWNQIQAAQVATTVEAAEEKAQHSDVRLEYRDFPHFQQLVRQLHPPLMDDEKAMVPRTAYKGVVETRPHGNHLLFLTPPLDELRKEFAGAAAQTIAEKADR